MDWSGCDLVEVVPGKVSGVPLVKGTRIPADFVLEDASRGRSVDDIRVDFPSLSEETVNSLLRFAKERSAATAA